MEMKNESFDEREIYLEGVLDGLALALDYPENVGIIRDHLASIKARAHWQFELEEILHQTSRIEAKAIKAKT